MSARVSISAKEARYILTVLEHTGTHLGPAGECIRRALSSLKSPKKRQAKRANTAAKRQKWKSRAASWAEVRAAVFRRAGLACECGCGRWFRGPLGAKEPDHFFGKARSERLETVWALRADCHESKTNNRPSADHWRRLFIQHCNRFGYAEAADMARADIESESDIRAAAALSGRAP